MYERYLGDSVYVRYDGYNLIISTNNGEGHQNIIHLEPEVQIALVKFFEELNQGKISTT